MQSSNASYLSMFYGTSRGIPELKGDSGECKLIGCSMGALTIRDLPPVRRVHAGVHAGVLRVTSYKVNQQQDNVLIYNCSQTS